MAVRRCTFPWGRLRAKMPQPAKVAFSSRLPSDLNAQITFDPPKITLDDSLRGGGAKLAQLILAEAAHLVDHYVLTAAQRRAILDAFIADRSDRKTGEPPRRRPGWFLGDYEDQVGESFMGGFVRAYSDFKLDPDLLFFSEQPTPIAAAAIRRIIG